MIIIESFAVSYKTASYYLKDGEIHMTDANCPDHLCMKQKAVDSTGGTIVCLPNKVVIEGEKGEASEDDSPEFDTVV